MTSFFFSVRITSLLLLLVSVTTLFGSFGFSSLPAPPAAEEIGEIKFDRRDWSVNNSEAVSLSRNEFLRYFVAGTFFNTGKSNEWVYQSGHFKEALNSGGGSMYCSGAFATKAGRIFTFKRPRIGVLEIEDADNRSGLLILPEFK